MELTPGKQRHLQGVDGKPGAGASGAAAGHGPRRSPGEQGSLEACETIFAARKCVWKVEIVKIDFK